MTSGAMKNVVALNEEFCWVGDEVEGKKRKIYSILYNMVKWIMFLNA